MVNILINDIPAVDVREPLLIELWPSLSCPMVHISINDIPVHITTLR